MQSVPPIQIQPKLSAKRLKLRVYPDKICLTAPIFASQSQIQAFIQQSEAWLLETWRRQQAQVSLPVQQLQLFNLVQPIKLFINSKTLPLYGKINNYVWIRHSRNRH